MTSRCATTDQGSTTRTVLLVGQATLDHLYDVDEFSRTGHKTPARSHRTVGGGVAANAAVAVARLGGDARFVGRVGDDPAGDQVVAGLRDEGVDVDHVERRIGGSTPISAVIVAADGARTIVNHTPRDLFAGEPPSLPVDGVDAVLVDARWPAGTEAALESARRIGVPGIVDVDAVPTDPERRCAVLTGASHLVFSADALRDLTGTTDPADGLRRAAARTDARLSVTCGEDGVVWLDDGEIRSMPAFAVDAVDTTGAGDVFHGAFALALAEGKSDGDALRFAAATAALKCSRPGARAGIPTRQDVDDLLEHTTTPAPTDWSH